MTSSRGPRKAESSVDNTDVKFLAGAVWMISAGLLFVAVAVIVRYLSSTMPSVQAAFIRYAFGLMILLPVLFRMEWRNIGSKSYGLYILRGSVHAGAVILWFFAMSRISIAEVTAIGYTAPIFTTLGAVIFFKETIRIRRVLAIVFGFIGVLIIIRPGFTQVSIGSLAQLLAAPCFAVSFLLAKQLTKSHASGDILALLSVGCTLTLLPGALLVWVTPTSTELMWLMLVAVFATVGHYALTRAIACAPLSLTQPFSFLQLLWAVIFGYIFFGDVPDIWVIAGGGLILGSVTYMSHRESKAIAK